jgi:hypothetical protein
LPAGPLAVRRFIIAAASSACPSGASSTATWSPRYCSLPRRWIAVHERRASTAAYLKAKDLDVLRALLRRFYSHRDGTCFPSYDAVAEAAGCCRATVAAKLRILEQLGIVETIRRKVIASFTSRVHRVRFDVAVQTSNSYRFNVAVVDRPVHGDMALPLPKAGRGECPHIQAESKLRPETSIELKPTVDADFAKAKEQWVRALLGTDKVGQTAGIAFKPPLQQPSGALPTNHAAHAHQ